jgi:hypothetical protein
VAAPQPSCASVLGAARRAGFTNNLFVVDCVVPACSYRIAARFSEIENFAVDLHTFLLFAF